MFGKTFCKTLESGAKSLWVIAAVLLAMSLTASAAQPVQVVLDPSQTQITWSLGATMHTVHGTFKLKSGQISFDPATGTANGELVVDSASGESGNHSRDDKMHKDVLETKRYPEITFLPKRVTGRLPIQGSGTVQVHGTFHIHGTDHELVLPVSVQASGNEARATTSFTVPYVAWGMKNPGNLILHVDDKVEVTVNAVGRLNSNVATH